MKRRIRRPLAQEAYDELAEAYAERVDTKPHNAYYERPATLSLLPPVKGKHVLDAGCGPGVYAEWLVEHGAQVVAVDGNRKMVRLAHQRLGDRVKVLLVNLEKPLNFARDGSFDIIIAPLVLDYIKDWYLVFKEFFRLLASGGALVFSMEHPYSKYDDHRETSNYFDTDLVAYTWRGFGKPVSVPSYRRSMSQVINPLLMAGFTLDYLLEPLPTLEFKASDLEEYEHLMRNPGFMCIRALKR
jgi:ubiquinone/menaquinone biosynthesis C-methylase UbiE